MECYFGRHRQLSVLGTSGVEDSHFCPFSGNFCMGCSIELEGKKEVLKNWFFYFSAGRVTLSESIDDGRSTIPLYCSRLHPRQTNFYQKVKDE